MKVKRMCHGGTKHQQTTRTEHFYSETDATKDYFTLRKPKVPGRGGRTCRPRHDKKPWVPSEKKERFASLSRVFLQKGRGDFQHSKKILLRPEKREKKFFRRQNGQRQEAENFFFENLSSSEVSSRKNDGGSRTELAGRQKCVKVPR